MNQAAGGKGITGSTLKIIAIAAMLIDHIGAAVLERMMMAEGYLEAALSSSAVLNLWMDEHGMLFMADFCMRSIGRIAFPIFCFLLVEGFQRTGNVKKYALRLGLFSLISEVPFDLAFSGELLEFKYQNVFFTLFLGLVVMMAVDWTGRQKLHPVVKAVLDLGAVLVGMAAADLLHTDYYGFGILCIMALYFFRQNRGIQAAAGVVAFLAGSFLLRGGLSGVFGEMAAVAGFIPVYFYNGQRGLKMKYVFYAFYPVHLLILYGICFLLKIQNIMIR